MTAAHHTPHQAPDLFALSEIHGPVLRPGDGAYLAEVTGFKLSAFHNPDIVVGAAGVADIVTAMRWAAAADTPVAVPLSAREPCTLLRALPRTPRPSAPATPVTSWKRSASCPTPTPRPPWNQ